MAFADDMIPPLRVLAKKLVELELYGYLSEVANLLTTLKCGSWPSLSLEDQELYLVKMVSTFNLQGLGDTAIREEPEYDFVFKRICRELCGLR